MNRHTVVKKQQRSFMIYNFFTFTLIFAIFSIIILGIVKSTLYSQSDEELYIYREKIEMIEKSHVPPIPLYPDLNPRIITLKWDDQGEIINKSQFGIQNYELYLKNLHLEEDDLNKLRNIKIGNRFSYRSLLFASSDGKSSYTQIMMNIDAEQSLIEHFTKILASCTISFILLSITASYILSKRTMKPIVQSWNRQTEFVENASHELRTPLTIIQNKLELLLRKPHSKVMDQFESIALSLSETRRLSKLTSDLLTLARSDSTVTQLQEEPFELDAFIGELCIPYKDVAQAEEKNFDVNFNSFARIKADKNRIHQLMVILLDNSLKYTSEGDRISIQTGMEEGKAVIKVGDSGIGISKDNLSYIFDRFYREDKARSREKGGTGLGLSIAQWIVESHKGTITVESTIESGTIFTIKLPIYRE